MPRESNKKKTERMQKILDILSAEYPEARIRLEYSNPFELLVATVLSAQCTDERVNIVTKDLFQKYRSVEEFAAVSQEELEKDIYSTGFYKAKAKNIRGAARKVLDDFGGKLPDNIDQLTTLPGVGRKTANVILGHEFKVSGIVVDTHVIRLTNRLGFVDSKNAVTIEFALMELVPKDQWVQFTHLIISHGRSVCRARKPLCFNCAVSELCPSRTL